MADSTDYSDDNSDGFVTDSDGTWADSSGDTTGDYDNWDWRKIMAAICGGSAYTDNSTNDQRAQQYSNPQTIQTAADTLWYVEQVLQEVAESISDQTNALTGQDGPWQGQAAQALNSAMTGVSQQVTAMANVLSGGVTGDDNVPQQLANNAQHLREAIAKVGDIDTWYANQAVEVNPDLQMDNGLVMVSKDKQIVTMMSNDMRQVLTTLAKHYELNKDAISQPNSPTNPNNDPGSSQDGQQPGYEQPGSYYTGGQPGEPDGEYQSDGEYQPDGEYDGEDGQQPGYEQPGSYYTGEPDGQYQPDGQYDGEDGQQPGYQPASYDPQEPQEPEEPEEPEDADGEYQPGGEYQPDGEYEQQPGYEPASYQPASYYSGIPAEPATPDGQYEGVDDGQYDGQDSGQPLYYGVRSENPTVPDTQYGGQDSGQPLYYGERVENQGTPDQYEGVDEQQPGYQPAYSGYEGTPDGQYGYNGQSTYGPYGDEIPAQQGVPAQYSPGVQPEQYRLADRIPAQQTPALPLGQETPRMADTPYMPAQYMPAQYSPELPRSEELPLQPAQ